MHQAPSAMTWIDSLQKLMKHGNADVAAIIKEWNAGATQNHALLGAKAMCVERYLKMPPQALDAIRNYTSTMGWKWSILRRSFEQQEVVPRQHFPALKARVAEVLHCGGSIHDLVFAALCV